MRRASELTIAERRELRTQSRRIRKALEAVLDVARAMGCAHPFMYFEAEGWIHVLDGDHPSVAHSSTERRDSRPAVVFTLHDRTPPGSDVGAW